MKLSKWNILLIILLFVGGTFFIVTNYILIEPAEVDPNETTTLRTAKYVAYDYVTSKELEEAISFIQETYTFFDITGFQVDKTYTNKDKTDGYLEFVYYIDTIETNYIYKTYFNKKGYTRLDAPNVDNMNYEFTDEASLIQKVSDFQNIKADKLSYALAGKIENSKNILNDDGSINLNNFKTKPSKTIEKYKYDYNNKKLSYTLIVYDNEKENSSGKAYDITIE